jgi:hypothetical protein
MVKKITKRKYKKNKLNKSKKSKKSKVLKGGGLRSWLFGNPPKTPNSTHKQTFTTNSNINNNEFEELLPNNENPKKLLNSVDGFQYLDIIPSTFIIPNQQVTKPELTKINDKMKSFFSAFPFKTFTNIIKNPNLPYLKLLEDNKSSVYIHEKYDDCYSELDDESNQYSTIYLNSFFPTDKIDKNTFNKFLGNSIINFLNSEKRIFIGFIKRGPKDTYISRAFSSILPVAGHLNLFIIDKELNTLIHFEPKGIKDYFTIWDSTDIQTYLNNSIDNYVRDKNHSNSNIEELKLRISSLKYISTSSSTNMPQNLLNDNYCQSYVIYFAILYCINTNLFNIENIEMILQKLCENINIKKIKNFAYYFYFELSKTMIICENSVETLKNSLNNKDIKNNSNGNNSNEWVITGDVMKNKKSKNLKNNNFSNDNNDPWVKA